MQDGVGLLILVMMPIYMIIALDIIIIICSSINCPTVICLPHRMLFSREKPLVKSTPPRVYFLSYCFQIYYSKSPKIPWCTFSLLILFCVFARSIYPISYNLIYLFTVEGLTTSLSRWVASICSLCAGTVYIVLLGSPTGLITLFHNWGKYLPNLYCIIPSSSGKYWHGYEPSHITGLDAPTKFVPTLEVRKGNAWYRRG